MTPSSNNTSSTNVIDPSSSEKYVKAMIITGPVCSAQGFLINFGDVASGLWTLVLCLYILMLTFRYMCTSLVILSMVIIWPFNLTISLWGLVIQTPNSPFYDANNGSWCWISNNYKNYRVGFNYGITLSITIAVIILTAILYCRQRTISSRFTSKSLMWYPLIYIVLAPPLTIYRFAAIAGYDLPFEYDVPTISTPRNLQRRPTPIYGIQRPLSPYSPTNSNIMLLSSPSPTTTTFSIQFSPPISPATPTFPTPLSPSFINSPTRVSQSPPYRTMYNPPTRYSLSNTYESSSSSTRYSYPERNDSLIPSITVKKSTSKHVNSLELEKSDQKTSSSKHKLNKPRPSTF
ncbi:30021_t:CDS:2, partial [Racocetra persica]